ncbi:MAG: DUF2325 domain-containing protein [Lautropia sp.]|nr:DUF2325 domain-containing protein [Lautropia sp.]
MQDRESYLGDRPTLAILKNPSEGTLDISTFEPTVRQPARLAADNGSRRRKLWDLAAHCHCPVIGLCLSMQTLRKLAGRTMEGPLPSDDYELHVNAVNECRRRGDLSELLQKELDQRYAMSIRKLGSIKTAEALYQQWRQFVSRNEATAGLWACMTHPRCDAATLERIYREIHMLQHQASAASRDRDERYQTLAEEHARCQQDIEKAQQRYQALQVEKAAESESLNSELQRLRADNAGKENTIRQLQEELETLRRQSEDLDSRIELSEQVRWLSDRNQELMQRIVEMRRHLVSPDQQASTAEGESSVPSPAVCPRQAAQQQAQQESTPADQLDSRAVLCVGGRHAAISIYRRIVEKKGGRFIHHDGGREDSVHRLDASLAAADLVICQAGCISHSAYWLVKDHCKRTGKRCVYVDKPSASAFARGLAQSVQEDSSTMVEESQA